MSFGFIKFKNSELGEGKSEEAIHWTLNVKFPWLKICHIVSIAYLVSLSCIRLKSSMLLFHLCTWLWFSVWCVLYKKTTWWTKCLFLSINKWQHHINTHEPINTLNIFDLFHTDLKTKLMMTRVIINKLNILSNRNKLTTRQKVTRCDVFSCLNAFWEEDDNPLFFSVGLFKHKKMH